MMSNKNLCTTPSGNLASAGNPPSTNVEAETRILGVSTTCATRPSSDMDKRQSSDMDTEGNDLSTTFNATLVLGGPEPPLPQATSSPQQSLTKNQKRRRRIWEAKQDGRAKTQDEAQADPSVPVKPSTSTKRGRLDNTDSPLDGAKDTPQKRPKHSTSSQKQHGNREGANMLKTPSEDAVGHTGSSVSTGPKGPKTLNREQPQPGSSKSQIGPKQHGARKNANLPKSQSAKAEGKTGAPKRKDPKRTNAKGPSGSKPKAPGKPTFSDVVKQSQGLVFNSLDKPEGYSSEELLLIQQKLEVAVQTAQSRGEIVRLKDPGRLKRMFKITPLDEDSEKWLRTNVNSILGSIWPRANFSLQKACDLPKMHKGKMLVPSQINQTAEQILSQIKGTNKLLCPDRWIVHVNKQMEGTLKGNLLILSVTDEDRAILEKLKNVVHLGLHEVKIVFEKRRANPTAHSIASKSKA